MDMYTELYKLVPHQRIKPELYNSFFNPNICHVCKLARQSVLVTCDLCRMISYCSKQHRLLHHPQHMQFCAAIKTLLWTDEKWYTRRSSMEGWLKSRRNFVSLIRQILSRDLQLYEIQMIMFAKSCLICHQQTSLYTCITCYSANFCSQHGEEFVNRHNPSCRPLLLHLNIAIKIKSDFAFCMKFSKFPNKEKSVVDMDSFMQHYRKLHNKFLYYSSDWACQNYFYTDYLSGSLTVYYGMKAANLLDSLRIRLAACVVHIIAANYFDWRYVPAWELFLHFFHTQIKDLKIILIGLELTNIYHQIILCDVCKLYKQKLSYICYGNLYHNYVNSDLYEQPNIIVGFQVDLSFDEIWSQTLLKLRESACPLLLTAKSEFISEQNNINITAGKRSSLKRVYHDKNKFSSLMPYRESDGNVSYRNKYLAIYLNLHNVSLSC